MRSHRLGLLTVVAALPVAAALAAACSNSASNPTPVYDIGGDAAAESAAPADTGVPGDSSSTESSADSSRPGDAQPADASETSVDAASCAADAGCWSCTPSTTAEFLNQCTASQCTPFDNLQRLPDYDGGALPPLQ
jgi:hypothetical protein